MQVILVLTLMKQTPIRFNLQRDGTGNGLSNMKNTFAERLQQQMLVLYHILSIFKAGLSNIYDDWEKYLKKYLMCHIPIKILKQHAIRN